VESGINDKLPAEKPGAFAYQQSDYQITFRLNLKSIKVSVLHRNPFLKEPVMKKCGALQDPLPLGFFIHGQQDL
jgi:hypothetical protein